MRQSLFAAAALVLATLPAQGALILPPSIAQRVATADIVVVGKVTAVGDKTVTAERYPGSKVLADFRVATVKIDSAIRGAKGMTEIKVGFVPPMPRRPGQVRPFIRPYPGTAIKLEKGQEVLLFLKAHSKEKFYTIPAFYDIVHKKAPNFESDVAEARKYAKLLAQPMVGLKAKSAEVRFETAAVLILRYRTIRRLGAKQEPINATESKLILEALANADWKTRPMARPGSPRQLLTPLAMFYRLGLQQKDGWQPPLGQPFDEAAKTWLKANASTYRIQRYVSAK